MGERGIFGLRYQQQDKLAYVHWGSGPEELGKRLVEDLHLLLQDRPGLWAAVARVQLVYEHERPTAAQRERWRRFQAFPERPADDWYGLLRQAQGQLAAVLEAGFLLDASGFVRQPDCECGHIANFDDECVEVYAGCQTRPHERGRYAGLASTRPGFYPLALVGSVPFAAIAAHPAAAYEQLLSLFEEDARSFDSQAS